MDASPERPAAPVPKLPARRDLPPFAALRAFDAAARLGGVRRAAQELGLDHTVISRHLRAIEAWTGAALFERGPAGSTLTPEGARYHRQVAAAIDLIAEATAELTRRNDERQLQIWCMPGFAFQWLMGRLAAFETANPKLEIELRPADAGPDFARHEADIDIRYQPTFESAPHLAACARTAEIARPAIIPVASPDYVTRHGQIRSPAEAQERALLHEDNCDNWKAWFAAYGLEKDELAGPRLWHGHLTMDAARRGRGVALGHHFLAADDLAAGRLARACVEGEPFRPLSLGAYVFIARADRWDARPVARFRKWLMAQVAAELPAGEVGSGA